MKLIFAFILSLSLVSQAASKASRVANFNPFTGKQDNLTTFPLRCHNAYFHMMKRSMSDSTERVLIVGPGLVDDCLPQVHEIQAIYPDAQISILDISTIPLRALKKSNYKKQLKQANFIVAHKENFGRDYSEHAQTWLTQFVKRIPHQLNMEKITAIHADIREFQTDDKFDVIIATNSLIYPIQEGFQGIELLTKLLLQLNDRGELFIETNTLLGIEVMAAGRTRDLLMTEIATHQLDLAKRLLLNPTADERPYPAEATAMIEAGATNLRMKRGPSSYERGSVGHISVLRCYPQ